MKVADFWQDFLRDTGLDKNTSYSDCYYFALNEEIANSLLELVLSGKKQATASSLLAYEKEQAPLPQVGEYSVITDFDGEPWCVVQTKQVRVIPFNEMTFVICQAEGEDENLASWKNGHRKFFNSEGETLGYQFTETMPIVFENFKMIYRRFDKSSLD